MKAAIIVNPQAGGGTLGKQWPKIAQVLRAEKLDFAAMQTTHRGQGTELARQALGYGCDLIIAAGGDGTVHEVVNGMINDGRPINPEAALGIISAGTGSDFTRSIGLPRDAITSARLLARSTAVRMIDMGEVETVADQQIKRGYFINVAGLGFASEVLERAERQGKRGGGTIPYLGALLMTIFQYRNKEVLLRVDGRTWEGVVNSVVICNGQFFGGGMRVGPQASLDDGQLDVLTVGVFTPFGFLWNTPRLYRGTHLRLKQVTLQRGRTVQVESPQRLSVQADGELIGECPATFRVLPGILRLRA